MSLIEYPIKNKQFTIVVALMLFIVGVKTLLTMPRAEDPDMQTPRFPVYVIYPGTSVKDMEQLVVKPLESRLYGLDRINRIKTHITNGNAFLFVEYEHTADYNAKYQELIRELAQAQQQDLPPDIYAVHVAEVDPTNIAVIQMALVSENAPRRTLKKVAQDLKTKLENVKELKNVAIDGLPEQLIRVDLNMEQLAELKIPISRITDAIGSEAVNIPGGLIHAGQKSLSVRSSGSYQSIDEIKNTIVSTHQGKNILLSDVADVYQSFAPVNHITRFNNNRALFISACQKKGMNIQNTQKKYLKVIEEFKETLPENIDLILNFDQADNVSKRLNSLGTDFCIAISLVLLTLLPLGLRASFIVMIAIPLSLAIGLLILNFFGFSLNQISILGFVIALGLVVDDSIVVVENMERWMREGYSRFQAAVRGTKQIALAVLGCTVTLIIAFLPFMFLPNMAGDFIRGLPVAIIGSIVGSLIVALLIVPLLGTKILNSHQNSEGNRVLQLFKKVINATYSVWLDKALKKPRLTVLIAAGIFATSIALLIKLGFGLFPASEKPQFMVTLWNSMQSNIYHSDSLTRIIENELQQIPEVKYFSTNVGKGNPRIYYNRERGRQREDFAEVFVQLHEEVNATEKMRIIEELREKWDSFLDTKIAVQNFEQGVPILSPVEVRIFGDNLDTLKNIAARVEKLLDTTKGTRYVSNPLINNKTDLKININKQKAIAMGVPSVAIDKTVRMALAGVNVATYSDPKTDNDDYKINVSVKRKDYADLSIFNHVYVNNVQGTAIPLNHLASVELEPSPSAISHIDKKRVVYVNSFVQPGFTNSFVINDVAQQMENYKLPEGYTYEMGGEVESTQEAFGGFTTVILITAFLFTAVLLLEFKTFKSTLIVMSVIPLGMVGASVALWITGHSLAFTSVVGLIALAGVEVKNTILLVDFTNQLRKQGVELNDAIEKAGEIRFLPIILTSLTAIGGLMPIAMSHNPMISPLAIVMIGGLISSTLLSRIVTPVIYKLIPPKIEIE